MKKIESIIFNKLIIYLLLFIFLKPGVINSFSILNEAINILMIIISIFILFFYLIKKQTSGILVLITLFFLSLLFSTCLFKRDLFYFCKIYIPIISLMMYSELLIKYNKSTFLNCYSHFFSFLIIMNFFSLLANFSFFSDRMSFLGYDNNATIILIIGYLFVLIRDNYVKQNKLESLVDVIALILTAILVRSATYKLMVACLIIFLFFVFKKKNFFTKLCKIQYVYLLFIFLFFFVVIFRFQSIFSFLIEDILHRNITFTGRVQIWDNTISLISKNPLFGYGVIDPSLRTSLLNVFHAHNTILNILLEGGIFSLIFYCILLLFIYKIVKNINENNTKQIFVFGLFVILITGLNEFYVKSSVIYLFLMTTYYANFLIDNSKRKHIVIVTSGVLPVPAIKGGAVESLIDLTLDYNNNNEKNWITIYSVGKRKNYLDSNNEYYYINKNGFYYKLLKLICAPFNLITKYKFGSGFINWVKLNILFNYHGYQNIFCVVVENNPLFVLPLKNLFSNKIILHVHNDWLNISTPRALEITKNCSMIIVVSKYIESQIKSVNPQARTIVIYNGIDEDLFRKKISTDERNRLKGKYNINCDDFVFLYTGKLNKYKGADILINAFKKLAIKYNNVKLFMVGSSFSLDDKDNNFIKQLKNDVLELENKIIFTGFIDYKNIYKIYNLANVQIVPSQGIDACPLTVIEGIVSGKALITSNSGGIPELVNEKNSIIIPLGDNFENDLYKAMERLYNDNELLETMQNESKVSGKKFYKNIYCKKYFGNILDVD